MQLKTIDIKLWEPDCVLPIGAEDMLASSWRANAEQGGSVVVAQIFPSAAHAGFVHYLVMRLANGECWESKQPVYPSHVGDFLNHALKPLNLNAASMTWVRTDDRSPDASKPAFDTSQQEFVYFLGAGPFVKIGKATGSPHARIADLRTGCPYPITLLASLVGGLKEEFALHKRFADYRTHGEWFRHEGTLAEFVASVGDAQ